MHIARPDGCFQAATGEECLEELRIWSGHSPVLPTLTFHEAVEMACRGGMSEEMQRTFANLGPLNLFAVISGKVSVDALPRTLANGNVSCPFTRVPAPELDRRVPQPNGNPPRPRQLEADLGDLL